MEERKSWDSLRDSSRQLHAEDPEDAEVAEAEIQSLIHKRCEHAKNCRDLIQTKVAKVGVCRAWVHVGATEKRDSCRNFMRSRLKISFGSQSLVWPHIPDNFGRKNVYRINFLLHTDFITGKIVSELIRNEFPS